MCPRKQTTELKLLILVLFFSGEVTSYTDTDEIWSILVTFMTILLDTHFVRQIVEAKIQNRLL